MQNKSKNQSIYETPFVENSNRTNNNFQKIKVRNALFEKDDFS